MEFREKAKTSQFLVGYRWEITSCQSTLGLGLLLGRREEGERMLERKSLSGPPEQRPCAPLVDRGRRKNVELFQVSLDLSLIRQHTQDGSGVESWVLQAAGYDGGRGWRHGGKT